VKTKSFATSIDEIKVADFTDESAVFLHIFSESFFFISHAVSSHSASVPNYE
jgi:hypothetical protein